MKDAIHRAVVEGDAGAVNPAGVGTKAAVHYVLHVPAGGERVVRLRLRTADTHVQAVRRRVREGARPARSRKPTSSIASGCPRRRRRTSGGCSGRGTPDCSGASSSTTTSSSTGSRAIRRSRCRRPAAAEGRNADWPHVFNRDIISMPDKWEYPWFAAWDLAFHMIPFARIDPHFAKEQLLLLLREWYMHPNGQIPAYEFAFGDVNPPVHAWACWRVYKMTGPKGRPRSPLPRARLPQAAAQLHLVGQSEGSRTGRNLFAGGFLGLDNIGVFDRSQPLPTGGHLEQADGTAWMAFYCNTMLAMALELASEDPAYEDVASKFFEHFIAIADAINTLGGTGLWSEDDGFYYDQLHVDGRHTPLRIRSLVGVMPLIAVEVLEEAKFGQLEGFKKRMNWFLENRPDLARQIACMLPQAGRTAECSRLLAIPSRERLERVLRYLLDETEFLSPYGIRSVSRVHREHPYQIEVQGTMHRVDYDPGESSTGLFGGNSNWRGPVWFPLNYLILEALERFHHFYGADLGWNARWARDGCSTSRRWPSELAARLARIFLAETPAAGRATAPTRASPAIPHWKNLVLFHEYFHGDTGRGVGASHQTGWTALVLRCIEDLARRADAPAARPTRRMASPADWLREPRMSTSPIDERTEWLEADGLGGFASGTAAGPRTRRYHALLLTAQTPPTGRMVLVNGLDAWVDMSGDGEKLGKNF